MFKIRDDVDLKELEKFRFLIDKSGFCEKKIRK